MRRLETFPRFGTLGFFTGQFRFTKTVFHGLKRDLHFITHSETALTIGVSKLVERNNPFRFQTGVDSDPLVIDINNHARHDGPRFHVYSLEAFFK